MSALNGGGRPRTSTRDAAQVQAALTAWFAARLDTESPPRVTVLGGPSGAGFSSETVLFDLAWETSPQAFTGSYVLRLPPPADAFPLFPSYDLERQVAAMRFVGAHAAVPVPQVRWWEPDPATFGCPFFVMDRVDGLVPSDVPPYVFGGWLADAEAADQRRAEEGIVAVLAGIHGIDVPNPAAALLELPAAGDTPLQRHVNHQRAYYDWIRGAERFELIDAAFEWLDSRWPAEEPNAVVSWGDARPANVLFRHFEPVAVLDWEAVALGPRELDLGWLIFFHGYFQRVASRHGRVGMPEFLDRDRVVARYQALTGYVVRDLDWYLAYAELRQALTAIRVSSRAVHFGERLAPDDLNDLIIDRAHLEQLVSA